MRKPKFVKKGETMKKTGTKEWAVTNVNIQLGCENGCRYCYARYNAVKFRKWCTVKQWLDPVTIIHRVTRSYLKRDGVVMYPSTHDITPRNLADSICVLRKLLKAGNKVLLVSKPRIGCISTICDELLEYRKRLMFRFTIGSLNNYVLSFWEPDAPTFGERKQCLIYAWSRKFHTSVSCEPFLDCEVDKIAALFEVLEPYVTDSFWIGKLRHFTKRVVLDGATPGDIERFVEPLRAAQSDEFVLGLCQRLNRERQILWKDSIREVIEK
jgi:DNA repair photolyase